MCVCVMGKIIREFHLGPRDRVLPLEDFLEEAALILSLEGQDGTWAGEGDNLELRLGVLSGKHKGALQVFVNESS